MIDYIQPGNSAAIIARLADPAIRIVSLTITEGGYFIDPASGAFNPDHPAIAADANAIDRPSTVFGLIVAFFAVKGAIGAGSNVSTKGAVEQILGEPYGQAMMWCIVVGLLGYAFTDFTQYAGIPARQPGGPSSFSCERRATAGWDSRPYLQPGYTPMQEFGSEFAALETRLRNRLLDRRRRIVEAQRRDLASGRTVDRRIVGCHHLRADGQQDCRVDASAGYL